MAKNETKNEKNTQTTTDRAVNTRGGMRSGNKTTNCNQATQTTGDGCGCGDGERKK